MKRNLSYNAQTYFWGSVAFGVLASVSVGIGVWMAKTNLYHPILHVAIWTGTAVLLCAAGACQWSFFREGGRLQIIPPRPENDHPDYAAWRDMMAGFIDGSILVVAPVVILLMTGASKPKLYLFLVPLVIIGLGLIADSFTWARKLK